MFTRILNSNANARVRKKIVIDPSSQSDVTFIIPVFDQEEIIYKHLQSICENALLSFELTIVNDASTDDTNSEILRFLNQYNWGASRCTQVNYFETVWPWFETKCDDFAIRAANSRYILEIQADMLIRQRGFDKKLLELLESESDIFALSARGVHSFSDLYSEILNPHKADRIFHLKILKRIKFKLRYVVKSRMQEKKGSQYSNKIGEQDTHTSNAVIDEIFPYHFQGPSSGRAGFLGPLIENLPYLGTNEFLEAIKNNSGRIWFGETIMRGPLIIDREKYLKVGGFNTEQFFLGNDDHDLNIRIKEFGYKVGFTPIAFASPLQLGNSRKKSKTLSRIWRKIHRITRQKEMHHSALLEYFRK